MVMDEIEIFADKLDQSLWVYLNKDLGIFYSSTGYYEPAQRYSHTKEREDQIDATEARRLLKVFMVPLDDFLQNTVLSAGRKG